MAGTHAQNALDAGNRPDAGTQAPALHKIGHNKPIEKRADLLAITSLVGVGSRVLDLGCGNGILLERLRDTLECDVYGIDYDEDEVIATSARRVPVLKHDLDRGLGMFPDDSFDVVILSMALMQVRNPKQLFDEMLRVGKRVIVTFPNFGYWKIRCYLAFKGRMPMSTTVPYAWYDTPNIHLSTLKDFRSFVADSNAKIVSEMHFHETPSGRLKRIGAWPNMRADTVIICSARSTERAE